MLQNILSPFLAPRQPLPSSLRSQAMRPQQAAVERVATRRVFLVPPGARLHDPNVDCLAMDEEVWERGYSLVIDEVKRGPLQDFWKHYYGTSAEMAMSGNGLMEFRKDIMAITPDCLSEPAVFRFLVQLTRMCVRAYSVQGSLQVVAE
ncbi:hypothetical protein [Variovorax sp. Root411]|uniref:hypothetical protein n=1 Tax=Variovorax sp. Root411 TaxID=1736530 RepID=UPI000ADEA954|nr:hypothetical protein [Variovorax sp. Root411]